jgi:glycosyltransferase involved in cell wall biosynthesis
MTPANSPTGRDRLKVLLASNMYAYSGNWDKLDALGRFVDLAVITPERWGVPELGQVLEVPEKSSTASWRQYRLPAHIYDKGNPFRFYYSPGGLSRVIEQERPDIVHVEQEPESINLLQFSLLKMRHHFPLVFVAWEDHNPLQLGWGFRKLNYALADAGIFGNQVAMDRAVKFGFRKKMEVIPQYGFEITYDGRARPDDGRFVVGYAGRLVPEKGILTLVEATRFMPNTQVLVAGEGPLAAQIRHEPHVKMLGWVARTEMAAFWSQLDVMVLPSLTDGKKWVEQFGRVLVEAMAAGIPVVGSDAGRIPDTVGDAGLIFHEGDATGLGQVFDALRTSPERRDELREKGLTRVRDLFSHEVLMGRTVRFYEEMLASRNREISSAVQRPTGTQAEAGQPER